MVEPMRGIYATVRGQRAGQFSAGWCADARQCRTTTVSPSIPAPGRIAGDEFIAGLGRPLERQASAPREFANRNLGGRRRSVLMNGIVIVVVLPVEGAQEQASVSG
jgi:hypothetical protein